MFKQRAEKIFVERFSNLFLLVFAFGICLHCYTIDAAKHTRIALFAGWSRVLRQERQKGRFSCWRIKAFITRRIISVVRVFFSRTQQENRFIARTENILIIMPSLPPQKWKSFFTSVPWKICLRDLPMVGWRIHFVRRESEGSENLTFITSGNSGSAKWRFL